MKSFCWLRSRFFLHVVFKMGNKEEKSFDQRFNESQNILKKFGQSRIPIICERHGDSLPECDKRKYLVPMDLTVGQFVYVIRKRIHIDSSQALFVTTSNGDIPATSKTMQEIYTTNKSDDNFLYLKYTGENTFGQ